MGGEFLGGRNEIFQAGCIFIHGGCVGKGRNAAQQGERGIPNHPSVLALRFLGAGGEANTIVAHANSRRWLAWGFLGRAGRVFLALTRNKFAVILESDTCAIRVKSIVFSVSRGGVGRTTIRVTVRTKFLACGDAEIL